MTTAKTPAGEIAADGFAPLEFERFRHGFVFFLAGLNGDGKASRRRAPSSDAGDGRAPPSEDPIFNEASITAGKLFEDEALRRSFHRRLELFGSLCREPAYERYLGFCRPSLHVAFVTALARFRFSKGMTQRACIAAFDEELRRQVGAPAELDRKIRIGGAGAATRAANTNTNAPEAWHRIRQR